MFTPTEGQQLFIDAQRYDSGDGVEKDLAKAVELYTKSVELEFVPAMDRLGEMYMSGTGVERDHAKGRELFRRASDLGSAEGTFNLGMIYWGGYGVEKDPDRYDVLLR